MNQFFQDAVFYFPGFVSVPILAIGALLVWLAWRLLRPKKKTPSSTVENSKKT